MELWIRSQDKEDLIKVDKKVCIKDYGEECFVPIFIDDFQVAQYRTKERALEVLDEIQNILKPKIIYTQKEPIETYELGVYQIKQDVDVKIQEMNTFVYEMPKD